MSTQMMALLEQRMRKECRNIKLTEREWGVDNDPTSPTQSKVLGAGFFPAYLEEEYPRNKQGIPFVRLVQINFAEVPPMEGWTSATVCQPIRLVGRVRGLIFRRRRAWRRTARCLSRCSAGMARRCRLRSSCEPSTHNDF